MRFIVSFIAGLAVGVSAGFVGSRLAGHRTTLTSLAPDEHVRVHLAEIGFFDRNFEIRIETLDDGQTTVVFRSPDEGRPSGSERIIWSRDSARFVLVGRHFFASADARLENGESLYVMHDLRTGEIWCNGTQQSSYPSFGPSDLAEIAWAEDGLPSP
jgi:hypothetical protein